MHKRILVLSDKNQFIPFNYTQSATDALNSMGLNSGNNVFGFSLQKITLTDKVKVDCLSLKEFFANLEEISSQYNAIIYSPANILAPWTKETGLKYWNNYLQKIKVPVYFIGVGSQSDRYYSLDFINDFKKEGYTFIKNLLATGGRLALRGYFTAEVVKKLGFTESDYDVIGCPSLFMNGPDLKIEKKNISKEELKPILNGNHFWFSSCFHRLFGEYPESIFICQDLFYRLLYDIEHVQPEDGDFLRADLLEYLFKNNRVRLYCDFLAWYNDIQSEKFNFSVGTRIHGNVVSLLAGIPAYIDSFDSRVREMAEFFDIPNGPIPEKNLDLYELYQTISYYKFNATFKEKFLKFQNFFHDCGLPCFEDKKYIDKQISKLSFSSPKYNTTLEQISDFTTKNWGRYYPGKNRFDKGEK